MAIKNLSYNCEAMYIGGSAVSAVYLGSDMVWSGGTPPTPPTPTSYLKFTNRDSVDGAITIVATGELSPSVMASTDGVNWTEYGAGDSITIPANGYLYLKGNNNDYWSTSVSNYASITSDVSIDVEGDASCLSDNVDGSYNFYRLFYGNNLLVNASGMTMPSGALGNNSCQQAFVGCTSLVSAPQLPSTEIGGSAYYAMFSGCTALVYGPSELPADVVNGSSYMSMFRNCSSLVSAPSILATSLSGANNCGYMFQGCTSLTTAPELPIETLTQQCYSAMFSGCTSLTTAPVLPAENVPKQAYSNMFNACNSLTAATVMAINVETTGAMSSMFRNINTQGVLTVDARRRTTWTTGSGGDWKYPTGWTLYYEDWVKISNRTSSDGVVSLGRRDGSDATTLQLAVSNDGTNWSGYTFASVGGNFTLPANGYLCIKSSGSTEWNSNSVNGVRWSLNANVPFDVSGYLGVLTDWNTVGDYTFAGLFHDSNVVDASGLKLLGAQLGTASYVYDGMFKGCSGLTAAPDINSSYLNQGTCREMFAGCTSLSATPQMTTTSLASGCYEGMYSGCTSLVSAPSELGGGLASECYKGMFAGCTSLQTAPSLPIITTKTGCYREMFKNCTSLTNVSELPAATVASYAYYEMFRGCSSLSDITCLATDITSSVSPLYYWLQGTAANGTLHCDATMVSAFESNTYTPSTWTVEAIS